MPSAQYVNGMQEMRSHFGDAADKWIEAIHDIYPEFSKVNVSFRLESSIEEMLLTTKHANHALLLP